MFVQISPVKWFDLYFDYTFTIARNVDANVPLVRRPQDIFNIRAEVRPWKNLLFGVGVLQVIEPLRLQCRYRRPHAARRPTRCCVSRRNTTCVPPCSSLPAPRTSSNRVYEEPEGFQAPYFQAFFGVKAKF